MSRDVAPSSSLRGPHAKPKTVIQECTRPEPKLKAAIDRCHVRWLCLYLHVAHKMAGKHQPFHKGGPAPCVRLRHAAALATGGVNAARTPRTRDGAAAALRSPRPCQPRPGKADGRRGLSHLRLRRGRRDAGGTLWSAPHQFVSLVVLGPGSSVSHDVLRLLARHGVGLVATGEDGVRFYTAQPLLPDFSHLARANRLQRQCRENDEYGNASTALYFRCTSAEACPRIYSRASSPT